MHYIRTPHEAELNAALRMREMGFPDATVTANGSDGGIDVRSAGALAQVKWRGGMVGRPELQNLFGARGHEYSKKLLFFAASAYSQHAVEYAEAMAIALFVYEPDGTLVPQNPHARVIATTAGRSSAFESTLQSLSPTSAPSRDARSGFWARRGWPFLKVHWRIVGAVFLTLAVPGGVGAVLNPDEAMGESRLGNFGVLVLVIIGAIVFWRIYFIDRDKKRRITPPREQSDG